MAENLNVSKKQQRLYNQMEELVQNLDKIYAEWPRITKPVVCNQEFVSFSDMRSYYLDLIKLYRHNKDCGIQISAVSSTSAGDKDPNKTLIATGNGAIENAEENFEDFSRFSATHGSRKQPSNVNSRSSRKRKIDEMEIENLRAEKKTEKRLQERQ